MENNKKPNKIKAYLWDIDGTIALRGERHPFDYTKVGEDTPNKNVQIIYQHLWGYNPEECGGENIEFIIITGREESCYSQTVEWLRENKFHYKKLFMRPLNNHEQDVVIKAQIYREHIEPFYDVVAVFEDRGRCIKLWRDHFGLTALQVDKGDF